MYNITIYERVERRRSKSHGEFEGGGWILGYGEEGYFDSKSYSRTEYVLIEELKNVDYERDGSSIVVYGKDKHGKDFKYSVDIKKYRVDIEDADKLNEAKEKKNAFLRYLTPEKSTKFLKALFEFAWGCKYFVDLEIYKKNSNNELTLIKSFERKNQWCEHTATYIHIDVANLDKVYCMYGEFASINGTKRIYRPITDNLIFFPSIEKEDIYDTIKRYEELTPMMDTYDLTAQPAEEPGFLQRIFGL